MRDARVENNLVLEVVRQAELHPERDALVIPSAQPGGREERATFAELIGRAGAIQERLRARGWREGDRAIVMTPVSVDLYALVLALVASRMVVVLIDPGMGIQNILWAARHCRARGIFTVNTITRLRRVVPVLRGLEVVRTDGEGGVSGALGARGGVALEVEAACHDDHALVTFTSGSTGRPKGADRTHRVLRAQHEALKAHFPNHEFEDPVDCTCFPVVVFHNLASGTTSALPPVDLRSPAEFDPAHVASYLEREKVTSISGAPAFMTNLCGHLVERGETLARIQRLLVGGGPVSKVLARTVLDALPGVEGEAWGVYGSTEAEPMAHMLLGQMLAHPIERDGFVVGSPVEEAELRLLGLGEHGELDSLAAIEAAAVTEPGVPGEIIVAGDHVVPRYLDDPESDRVNKLFPSDHGVWHRTGDVGQWDELGSLWLTGRVKDLIELPGGALLEPFALEDELDGWKSLERAALVSIEGGETFLVVVPTRWEDWEKVSLKLEGTLWERGLEHIRPVRLPDMPVDRRHQTKLDRPTLRLFLGLYRHLL